MQSYQQFNRYIFHDWHEDDPEEIRQRIELERNAIYHQYVTSN